MENNKFKSLTSPGFRTYFKATVIHKAWHCHSGAHPQGLTLYLNSAWYKGTCLQPGVISACTPPPHSSKNLPPGKPGESKLIVSSVFTGQEQEALTTRNWCKLAELQNWKKSCSAAYYHLIVIRSPLPAPWVSNPLSTQMLKDHKRAENRCELHFGKLSPISTDQDDNTPSPCITS